MADGDVTLTVSNILLNLVGTYDKEKDLGGNVTGPFDVKVQDSLANGTGDDQSDLLFRDGRSADINGDTEFAAGLDLAGGLTDEYGRTLTFVEVSLIYIKNKAAAGNLIVGGAAANAFSSWMGAAAHTLTIPPGGVEFRHAPKDGSFAVTAGAADLLKIAASAGTISYDIVLMGRSA